MQLLGTEVQSYQKYAILNNYNLYSLILCVCVCVCVKRYFLCFVSCYGHSSLFSVKWPSGGRRVDSFYGFRLQIIEGIDIVDSVLSLFTNVDRFAV